MPERARPGGDDADPVRAEFRRARGLPTTMPSGAAGGGPVRSTLEVGAGLPRREGDRVGGGEPRRPAPDAEEDAVRRTFPSAEVAGSGRAELRTAGEGPDCAEPDGGGGEPVHMALRVGGGLPG